ncbi:hypothetical protein [Legionella shakespearei]|uniref:Uncharacterized protein n=1 Tax=Legionella shakespearei DSM 23087 TaxID=1122169 RepID=A0A0W0YVD2_9GAMM|nr:hypothetical protein [Legionella shakespearei]KTD60842.1 hypothetical protein Lsha_1559 [Legionella shakespearei DSM 23087]
MSDFKSKLPDFQELTSMTSKLFKGLKDSVGEIIEDYKKKRAEDETQEAPAEEVKKEEAKPVDVAETESKKDEV